MPAVRHVSLYLFFALALGIQILSWTQVRSFRAQWLNIPPVPSAAGAAAFALGETQVAYRTMGLMLQNFGDSGGRVTNFKDYDYERLVQWFRLIGKFDPRSNFSPYLAAYYFSAVNDSYKISLLADYLYEAGSAPVQGKWQWLAQAVYLKRYKVNDFETAYKWSVELSELDDPTVPSWARQMPAFVKNAEGDKQAAYDILVSMLKSGIGKMPREEVNAITDYICDRVLAPQDALNDPICQTRE